MVRIKEFRLKSKMTQSELGTEIGVNQNAIAQYESGKIMPRADKLIKMSKLFGCTVDELLGVSDEK